jgi:hypothetical protein
MSKRNGKEEMLLSRSHNFLAGSVITFFGGLLFLFVGPFQNAVTEGIVSGSLAGFDMQEWQEFQNIHLGLKILMVPYFGVVVRFLLRIIRKAHQLFKNFKNGTSLQEEHDLTV